MSRLQILKVNTIIANVTRALHDTFHAVSNRHFSHYLTEFWDRSNHRFDLRQLRPGFSYVAVRIPAILQRLMKVAELCG